MPFRNDADAARERIEQLERELARLRLEHVVATQRNTELGALRARIDGLVAQRDQAPRWPLVRHLALIALSLVLATACVGVLIAARSYRALAADADTRAALADRYLQSCLESQAQSEARVDEMLGRPRTHATLLRARVTNADGADWTEVGDSCVLAVAHTSSRGPCTATLRCLGRPFPPTSMTCHTDSPSVLRYARTTDGRSPAIQLDVRGHTLRIRPTFTEPMIEAEVIAVTPFDMP